MTARKPRVGEMWQDEFRRDLTIIADKPDRHGRFVVEDQAGSYVLRTLSELRPPKLTLDDLPPIPEYWVNVYQSGPQFIREGPEHADRTANDDRIARVRVVPDADSIVACDGRTVL